MLLHRRCVSIAVDGVAALVGDQAGEVEREPEGVVELEGHIARELSAGLEVGHGLIEKAQALVERLPEPFFLSLHHFADEVGTLLEFAVVIAHGVDEDIDHLVEERLGEADLYTVSDGSTHHASQDIAALLV